MMENECVEVEVNMSVEDGASIVPQQVKEEENTDAFKLCSQMEGTKAPQILHAGSIGELETAISPHLIKKEPEEGIQQHWEAQWQEFLGALQASHSGWENAQMCEEPALPWEDIKAFLASFEQIASTCCWPRDKWVTLLLPALSREAREAFSSLSAQDREDYGKMKAAILQREAMPEPLPEAAVVPSKGNKIPPPDTWNLVVEVKQEWGGDEWLLGDGQVRVIQVDNMNQGGPQQGAPEGSLGGGDTFQYCEEETRVGKLHNNAAKVISLPPVPPTPTLDGSGNPRQKLSC
ncbi:UNVERIFIED_CONTAM: hypothetical protein K2H54_061837 [Gekko kuhli]